MIHEHSKKEYVRKCENYHAQFVDNFKLRIGSIYGRIWDESEKKYYYFVSTYPVETKGKMSVWIKVGDREWGKEKIPVESRICKLILGYCMKYGTPNVGRYNRKRAQILKENPDKIVRIGNKKFKEISMDCGGIEYRVSKELSGIVPGLVMPRQADQRTCPDFSTQYSLNYKGKVLLFYEYEDAEKFCDEKEISKNRIRQDFVGDSQGTIVNDYSYQSLYKDYGNKYVDITQR